RARETGEQQLLDTSNVRVITRAVQPLERVGPQRRVMVTLAAFAGLALGLLIAALSEAAAWMRRKGEIEPETAAIRQARDAAPFQGTEQRVTQEQPQVSYAPAQPSSEDDLLRLLRVMSRLEQAMLKHGTSR
ncbi:MAG: hypothetical protein ACRC7G_13205, partial [Beijerinckiaceae bacterium]